MLNRRIGTIKFTDCEIHFNGSNDLFMILLYKKNQLTTKEK
jgi:hypothetical protein